MTISTVLKGAAGEHRIMSELLIRGHVSALAPAGAKDIDILVAGSDGGKAFTVQVKTGVDVSGAAGWWMSPKNEKLISPTLFYAFVNFSTETDIYILPSAKVAEVVKGSSLAWVSGFKKDGTPRHDNKARILYLGFEANYKHLDIDCPYPLGWMDEYKSAWHLLD